MSARGQQEIERIYIFCASCWTSEATIYCVCSFFFFCSTSCVLDVCVSVENCMSGLQTIMSLKAAVCPM